MNREEIDLELRIFLSWLKDHHPSDWVNIDRDHLLIEFFDRLPLARLKTIPLKDYEQRKKETQV